MIKNRYDNKLRVGNQLILNLTPGNYVLRVELALELKKILKKRDKSKVLEIGSGEGDLTKYILDNSPIKIDCLDVSKEMIRASKKILAKYDSRINYICEGALEYLERTNTQYDVITSAWTIHNFIWPNKLQTFKAIYSNLKIGGKMLLMDKFYPDSPFERKVLLKNQLDRYRYLDAGLRKTITAHEYQDLTKDYRMDETASIKVLQKIGFKNIKVLDRVDRDILLVASK